MPGLSPSILIMWPTQKCEASPLVGGSSPRHSSYLTAGICYHLVTSISEVRALMLDDKTWLTGCCSTSFQRCWMELGSELKFLHSKLEKSFLYQADSVQRGFRDVSLPRLPVSPSHPPAWEESSVFSLFMSPLSPFKSVIDQSFHTRDGAAACI